LMKPACKGGEGVPVDDLLSIQKQVLAVGAEVVGFNTRRAKQMCSPHTGTILIWVAMNEMRTTVASSTSEIVHMYSDAANYINYILIM